MTQILPMALIALVCAYTLIAATIKDPWFGFRWIYAIGEACVTGIAYFFTEIVGYLFIAIIEGLFSAW